MAQGGGWGGVTPGWPVSSLALLLQLSTQQEAAKGRKCGLVQPLAQLERGRPVQASA